MKYIVYQTINLKNNKIYIGVHKCLNPDVFDGYIGCGVVITSPSSYSNPYTAFQYAVKKYGTSNFKRTTIGIFDNKNDAYSLEEKIITHDFLRRKDTYNVRLGGFSEGSCYVKINQFNTNGLFLKQWNSIIEASDFYNISDTSISNAYRYKGCCKGYFWSKENKINVNEYSMMESIPCYQYNLEGKMTNTYNSILEAAKDNDTTRSEIRRAIDCGYRVKEYYYSLKVLEEYIGGTKLSIRKNSLYVYSLNGDFIIELKNSQEIYDFFKIKSTHIITTCLKGSKPYKEYQFSLEKLDKMDPVINKRNIPKRVGRFSLTGDLLEEFDSITLAVEKYGFGISKCLKGQRKQCKNFIFKYI